MFKRLFSETLASYLGDYVKGFDSQQIAFWTGELVLENLQLRKKALNKLGLPVKVKGGYIGKLLLKVPWHNIKNEPLVVQVQKVYIVAGPDTEWNEAKARQSEHQAKLDKLALYEASKLSQQLNASSSNVDNSLSISSEDTSAQAVETQKGAIEALITKIVDNLQFDINDVHIRYEDDRWADAPFSFGITLEHLSAKSADENWNPTFLNVEHKVIHKIISLKNLSVYWNPKEQSPITNLKDMIPILDKLIHKDGQQPDHHYILNPVSGSLKLLLNKSNIPDKTTPKYTLNFEFNDISLMFEEEQYRQLVALLDWFTIYSKGVKYNKTRPTVRPKGNARAWWHFAYGCIVEDIREKRRRWTKDFFAKRRSIKKEYLKYYRRKKRDLATDTDLSNLAELEQQLSYEDIVYFRSLAEAQLKGPKGEPPPPKKKTNTGWTNWIWGASYFSGSSSTVSDDPQKRRQSLVEEVFELGPHQREEFFAAIEYDVHQKVPSLVVVDKECITTAVNFTMTTGSITLKTSNKEKTDIVQALFEGFTLTIIQRTDSSRIAAALESFKIYDKYTPGTCFPCLLSPCTNLEETTEPYFSLVFETNPLNSEHDYRFHLRMLPLEVVYNKDCIKNIVSFFGNTDSTTMQELEAAARKHIQDLTTKTASKLTKELENHKSLDLDVNISAPKIIVPESVCSSGALMLVVDLGNFTVTSVNKAARNDTFKDHLFYDQFNLSLSSIQLQMATSSSTLNVVNSARLVDKFDINISIYYCIKVDVLLTRLKIFADLPSLQFYISPEKSLNLLRILKTMISDSSVSISNTVRETKVLPRSVSISSIDTISAANTILGSNNNVVHLMVHTKFMECNISIPEVSITLMTKDERSDNEKPLIKVSAVGIGAQIIQRPYDTRLFFCLRKFTIEDQQQPWGAQFAYLATSETTGASLLSDKMMVQGSFLQVQRQSPEYGGVDQSLSLYFNTLHLMCNRETVVSLLQFVNTLMTPARELFGTDNPAPQEVSPQINSQKGFTEFKAVVNLNSIILSLNKEGQKISTLSVSNMSCVLEVASGGMKSKGVLGDVTCQDLTPEGKKYPTIFSINTERGSTEGHMVDFVYETFNRDDHSFPGYDAVFRLRVNSVRMVYLHRFFSDLKGYFSSLTPNSGVRKDNEPSQVAPTSQKLTKIEIKIENPQLAIPRGSLSNSVLLIDLGHISIFSGFMEANRTVLEKMCINVSAMNIRSSNVNLPEEKYIVRDINLSLELDMPTASNDSHKHPNLKISGELSSINILLTEFQYALLLGILQHNFRERSLHSHVEVVSQPSEVPKQESVQQQQFGISLQVQASLPQISLELFRKRDAGQESVVSICMDGIFVGWTQFRDATAKGVLAINEISLSDKRASSANVFKNLLSSSKQTSRFLKIDYHCNPTNQYVHIHVDHPQAFLVPEAIFAITEFIMPGIAMLSNGQPTTTKVDKPKIQSYLEIRATFANSEIHLLEDSSNPDSRAFVFNSTFLVTYVKGDQHRDLKIYNKKLEIYKCFLTRKASTAVSILNPLDFSIHSSKIQNTKPQMTVIIDTMQLALSYRDFLLLQKIIDTFTQSRSSKAQPTNEQPSPPKKTPREKTFKISGLRLTVIDDYKEQNMPLADIKFSDSSIDIYENTTTLRTSAGVDYYNMEAATWEPVIEPWTFQAKIEMSRLPNFGVAIKSSERLNVNFTNQLFKTMWNTVSGWKEEFKVDTKYKNNVPCPYVLRNQTGQKLRYWLSDSKGSNDVEDSTEVPLIMTTAISKNREIIDPQATLSILLIPWNQINGLPITRVGTYFLPLTPKPRDLNPKLVYEVSFRDGCKIITVRSNVRIQNATAVPIEVFIEKENQQPHLLGTEPLGPGEFRCVPVEYASNALIRFKPALSSSHYSWSLREEDLSQLQASIGNHLTKCPSIYPTESYFFVVDISGDKEGFDSDQYTIVLHPPLRIENLLPCDLDFKVLDKITDRMQAQGTVTTGLEAELHEVDFNIGCQALLKICIAGYDWSNTVLIEPSSDPQQLQLLDDKRRPLNLNVAVSTSKQGILTVSIYCRYWLINKTGLRLLYRSTLEHFNSEQIAAGQVVIEQDRSEGAPLKYDTKKAAELSRPFLFSYGTFNLFESKVSVKIADSSWSKGVSIESPGMEGFLEIPSKKSGNSTMLYELGVSIKLGKDKFYRTKVVTFAPRVLLINRMEREVYYKQKGTDVVLSLLPGEITPWHWINKELLHEICITLTGDEVYEWSCGFAVDQLGDLAVKIPYKDQVTYYISGVQIKLEKATFLVTFTPESKEFPPYRLENFTLASLSVGQKVVGVKQILRPYQAIPYTWDEPAKFNKLVVEVENSNFKKEFNLNIIRSYEPVEVHLEGPKPMDIILQAEIFADGPTRVMRLTDLKTHPQSESTSLLSSSDKTVTKEADIQQEFLLDIEGIGLSIIDNVQELVYISIEDINCHYSHSKISTLFECGVKKFQIDNQLPTTQFPVLLSSHNSFNDAKFFWISIIKYNQYETLDYFHYFSVLMQEVDLNIDDALLSSLLGLFNNNLSYYNNSVNTQHEEDSDSIVPSIDSKKVYFEVLHINPIKINLSYVSGTSGTDKQDTLVKTILSAVGMTLANLDGAQITFNALLLQHPFSTKSDLINRISKHYYMQALRELYKVVGAFDFLGNPVSLVNNLGTGVYDFFYEPVQGLIRSPQDFGKGLVKGSTSLVKNSVYGVFNTASKISGSLGKGLAALSMDQQYVREREINGRKKPVYVGEGIALGIKELGTGLYNGITGIIQEPLNGVHQEGGVGLTKGVVKAVIGATIKPVVGLIDFATRTTQAITYTTSRLESKSVRRVRPQRYLGPDKIVTPYSTEKSFGQHILYKLHSGKYKSEWYLQHFVLGNHILLLSDQQIFYINKNSLNKKWSEMLKHIKTVEKTRDSIIIHLHAHMISHHPQSSEAITSRRIHASSQTLERIYTVIQETLRSERILSQP